MLENIYAELQTTEPTPPYELYKFDGSHSRKLIELYNLRNSPAVRSSFRQNLCAYVHIHPFDKFTFALLLLITSLFLFFFWLCFLSFLFHCICSYYFLWVVI